MGEIAVGLLVGLAVLLTDMGRMSRFAERLRQMLESFVRR